MLEEDTKLVVKYRDQLATGQEAEAATTGQEVMERLFEIVGSKGRGKEKLIDKKGNAITGPNGLELDAKDYLLLAKRHGADEIILNFVAMPQNHTMFNDSILAMRGLVNRHFPVVSR